MKLSLVALGVSVALVACSSQGPIDGQTLEGASESGDLGQELSTGVPIGTTLYTTSALNLRSGSSTSDSILHVIPQGDAVVTVNRTTPVNGFYNVKHGGVE